MRLRPSLIACALLTLPAAARGGAACRCAELPIDTYYRNAAIVLVGRADEVRTVEPAGGAARVEVRFTPQFRRGPFKGSVDGVVFATPVGSASCGVAVQPGETYIVFASLGDPDAPSLAWFDSCSGSRLYLGGPRAAEQQPFTGLPNNRIVPRLFELAEGAAPVQEPTAFHTSPACWSEPRVAHQGTPPEDMRTRVHVGWTRDAAPDTGGVTSPNGVYRFWNGNRTEGDMPGGFVVVDVERPSRLRITGRDSRAEPQPVWINEKLLFVRLLWGRVQFTDLIVDVERGLPIYEEAARYSQEAFEQYREACIGQCPCFVVPGRTAELPAPPASRPAQGQASTLGTLTTSLAFLDGDWDGRVFTEPGGRAFTVSALKGARGREEYPADILEVREAAGGWWLRVALYRVSKCYDADGAPVHAGWVPAYSGLGRLVVSTYPGGC